MEKVNLSFSLVSSFLSTANVRTCINNSNLHEYSRVQCLGSVRYPLVYDHFPLELRLAFPSPLRAHPVLLVQFHHMACLVHVFLEIVVDTNVFESLVTLTRFPIILVNYKHSTSRDKLCAHIQANYVSANINRFVLAQIQTSYCARSGDYLSN